MTEFTGAFSRTEPYQAGQLQIEKTKRSKQVQPGITRKRNGSTSRIGIELNSRAASPAILVVVLIISMLALAMPRATVAQVLYGSLTGNVTDQAGAVVQGAKVQALNVNTGISKETTTDESGIYRFSNLQPGVYKVTVEAASFKTLAQEDVRVEANMVRRLDAQLQASGVSETISIAASATTLQTDRADVNITQSAREINNLPLFGSVGRNYQTLIALIPGATKGTGGFFIDRTGNGEDNSAAGNPQRSISYNINGVARQQNNTKIDGSSVIYPWLPTNTVYVPPAESIQEVNIVTNAFDAEQGIAGGAAVNVTIKTGTNGLHGAAWGYDTNSRFRSRTFFQPSNQPQNPKDILAQFGYAVGGPVYLPKIFDGRNKLFFFTDLERTTQRNTATGSRFTVAPASLRPDASGNVNFTGTGITVYDPLSNPNPALRTPFPNNTIPANRIDIAALELIERLPLPNLGGLTQNFAPGGVAEFNRTNVDTKVNYDSGGNLTVFGRYSISPTLIIDPPIFGEVSGPALNGGQLGTAPGRIQVIGIGGTYTFSPSVVLDANAGYTRQRIGAEGFDIVSNFGLEVLQIPGTNGPERLQGGVPSFQINGGWTNIGNDNTGNPFLFRDNQYVGAANLSWLKGSHSLRFGFDHLNQQLNHFQPQGGAFQTVRGTFVFNGNATKQQGNAASVAESQQIHSWADFLLGQPSRAGKVDQLVNPNSVWMKTYALYVRDHWQIGPRVTLTYGLRWEFYPFPTRDHTGVSRFDPDDGLVHIGGVGGEPTDTGAESGTGQFLPRVGIAFRWNDKTVIRGGYGQSADPRTFIEFRNSFPVTNAWEMPQINNNPFIPVTTLRQGLINTSTPPDLNAGLIPLPSNSGTSTYPGTPMRKEIHSFNVFIERELPGNITGQVGYVGTRATGQMGFININAGPPGTGQAGRPLFIKFGLTANINSIQPYGDTTYDALQATFKRRVGSSFFGTSYTWSKTTNFADNDGGPFIQFLPEKQRNKGLASYDRTHNLQSYWVYDLPFGKNQRWANSGWASKLLGGFQVNGVMSIMGGRPFNINQGSAPNLQAAGSGQFPNLVKPSVEVFSDNKKGTPPAGANAADFQYFDRSAFATEDGPRFGNVGRNILRGPGFFEVDVSIYRTFLITERVQFQFRAEALNATNHANFANPNGDISNPNFGFITATTGPYQSRQWRFGGRVSF